MGGCGSVLSADVSCDSTLQKGQPNAPCTFYWTCSFTSWVIFCASALTWILCDFFFSLFLMPVVSFCLGFLIFSLIVNLFVVCVCARVRVSKCVSEWNMCKPPPFFFFANHKQARLSLLFLHDAVIRCRSLQNRGFESGSRQGHEWR